ncbi:MAG: hypothetical protein LBQ47_07440 [Endomicrobium sp.]|nr:hypothetical protein [Endomicrobium sp.]
MWLACDHRNALNGAIRAIETLLKAGFTRNHINAYVLAGKDIEEELDRAKQIYKAGCMPFVRFNPLKSASGVIISDPNNI